MIERIGRRRARLGVPLDVLLRAVRLDFRVQWSAFLHRVAEQDLAQLVHNTVDVWDVVEEHSTRVHLSYVNETALLDRKGTRNATAG